MNTQIKWKWVILDIWTTSWFRSVHFEVEVYKGFALAITVPFMGFDLDICSANNDIYNGRY